MKTLIQSLVFSLFLLQGLYLSAADTNLALTGTASQSSTAHSGGASRAIDGDTTGTYNQGSVTHTDGSSAYDWWEVDLGSIYNISKIDIFNRTDNCCGRRLANVHVMISDTSFTKGVTQTALDATLASAGWKGQIGNNPGDTISFDTINTTGRYVLIQKSGNNWKEEHYLSLAEVEVYGSTVVSNPLEISQKPLFLSTIIPPNILLAIDDSGSMDAEILIPTNDGALWWNTSTNSFTGRGANADATSDIDADDTVPNFNAAGGTNDTWKKFIYLFPNGSSGSYDGRRHYGDGENDHYAAPPTNELAWLRSSDFNQAYFNPQIDYKPWPSTENNTFGQITPTAAPSDPQIGSVNIDLTQNLRVDENNWRFRFYTGMVVDAGTEIRGDDNWSILDNDAVVGSFSGLSNDTSYAVNYFPASFFSLTKIPDEFGYKETSLEIVGKTPGATSPDMYLYEIKPDNFTSTEKYTEAINNFANWFSYYRRRHLATRAGIAESFYDLDKARSAWFRINDGSSNVINNTSLKDLKFTEQRDEFLDGIYSIINSRSLGGTPNKTALNNAGQFFKNNEDAIQFACQANSTVLFTDGFSNTGSPDSNNYDGDKGAPYADTVGGTLADLAMKYYDSAHVPLRSDSDFPTGMMPVPAGCNVPDPDPALNCNTDLHMNFYAVTLGAKGILYDPQDPINPYQEAPPEWWTTFQDRNPKAVDDMWHATINGRGQLLNANTPAEISSELSKILDTILSKTSSSSTAVATTSLFLSETSQLFQASFDSNDWSGNLTAYKPEIDTDGKLTVAKIWDAASLIPAHNLRSIFSHDASGNGISKGISFSWGTGGLTTEQKSLLGNNEDLLNYIRGENITGMRPRDDNVMGDIINSDPVFSHKEHYGYHSMGADVSESSEYNTYVTNKYLRPQMIYVGANDGMLHAIDATTGVEKFAYIPSNIIKNLPQLASPTYDHLYYVDGKIHISDAYINGEWRTILIGTTGAGGNSIFALDISHPESFSASDVLWEFTHPQLGKTFGDPVIGRLKTGDWAVFAGNGYNSAQQKSQLFVINLETGLLERLLDTGEGTLANPNGLSSPAIMYSSEAGNTFISTIYAGDLHGHLWKFDLNNTNNTQWGVANAGDPVFSATHNSVAQPITVRPDLKRHPAGGMMVMFGTGSFFKEQDPLDLSVQTVYGIRDNGQAVLKAKLVEQEMEYRGSSVFPYEVTVISNKTVDYNIYDGWFLNLIYDDAQGERLVTNPEVWFNRLRFSTTIPNVNPCEPGVTSWALEIDYLNGSRLQYSIYDLDGDGSIDSGDTITIKVEDVDVPLQPVSGIKLDQAGALPSQLTDHLIINPEDDEALGYRSDLEDVQGRQTWREVR